MSRDIAVGSHELFREQSGSQLRLRKDITRSRAKIQCRELSMYVIINIIHMNCTPQGRSDFFLEFRYHIIKSYNYYRHVLPSDLS